MLIVECRNGVTASNPRMLNSVYEREEVNYQSWR